MVPMPIKLGSSHLEQGFTFANSSMWETHSAGGNRDDRDREHFGGGIHSPDNNLVAL